MSVHKRFTDLDGLMVDDYIMTPPSYMRLFQGLIKPQEVNSKNHGETDAKKIEEIRNLCKA
jgi:hypothetical protein